ncbi:MAG: DUF547 domain-containing protein [Candidatus Obscuribacterales bacterium]|nr:DUF547 domain-containing protein [Candidatus Obscuribacterales bacterium]
MRLIAKVICFLMLMQIQQVRAFDQSHQLFTDQLSKYLSRGLIHYKKLKEHPEGLDQYLASLANLTEDEYKGFSENQQKAFWINAYNALTIKNVLNHYPIKGTLTWFPPNSIRQVVGFWDEDHFRVAGQDYTLYTIVHGRIRKDFHDPRMHFAIVPASRGALPLRYAAYVGETIDDDLNALANKVVTDPQFVQFDEEKNEVRLSKIFAWFPLDFMAPVGFGKKRQLPPNDNAVVLHYVLQLLDAQKKPHETKPDIQVIYKPYDWALNDADAKKADSRRK